MMKRWPGYQQVLTLSMPAIEFLGTPEQTPELARLANDGMAAIVRQHPDRFPAFVASLPMNNVPASLEEMDRAIEKLGAKGVQIFTNVNGRPLDRAGVLRSFVRVGVIREFAVRTGAPRSAGRTSSTCAEDRKNSGRLGGRPFNVGEDLHALGAELFRSRDPSPRATPARCSSAATPTKAETDPGAGARSPPCRHSPAGRAPASAPECPGTRSPGIDSVSTCW